MTAKDIKQLLAYKHANDVFIEECKTGDSGLGMKKLDAWVMPKSWSNMNITGYEVKVSRSDFLNDNKWMAYLPYVNSMYFVCPSGLIQPEEVPENIGLMWVSKTGTKIYTKRKAIFQEKEIPVSLFQYILMWRASINGEHSASKRLDNIDFWENWIKERRWSGEVGRQVSKKLNEMYHENVECVRQENNELKEQIENLKDIRDFLSEIGLNPNSRWTSRFSVKRELEKLKSGIPEGFENDIKRAIVSLRDVEETLEKIKKEE